jgi:branched-subunit amino acid aminotransferase/4-amino-4-deoxychorismate lyase
MTKMIHHFQFDQDPWLAHRYFTSEFCLFETLRVYQGKVRCLSAHSKRITHSAYQLNIPIFDTHLNSTLSQAAYSLRDKGDCALRYSLTQHGQATLTWRFIKPDYINTDLTTAVVYCPTIPSLARWYKHSQRMSWIEMARQLAVEEVIFCDDQDYLLESNQSNLFALLGNELITPPFQNNFLPGITRQALLDFASQLNLRVVEQSIHLKKDYDALFLTSTLKELSYVKSIRYRGTIITFDKHDYIKRWQKKFHQYLQSLSTSPINHY